METKSVFATLSAVDCSKHTEKKGNLTYLSWAWAWAILLQNYPASSFEMHSDTLHDDGCVTVSCTVTVEGIARAMWLPVMDNRNNAIKNPDARKISDAKMRCLVKAIALHGLGLYIYAGEDIPEQSQQRSSCSDMGTSTDISAFESAHLQSMRDAAMDGMDALAAAFNLLPKSVLKTQFWAEHGSALKQCANDAVVIAGEAQ